MISSHSIALLLSDELLNECKNLPGFYDKSGSWTNAFETTLRQSDNPSDAIIQARNYINAIINLADINKIPKINDTHQSLITTMLLIAQQSTNINQAREIVCIAIDTLENLNQNIPESETKNYILFSLETMKHFINKESSLKEAETNIVHVLKKAIPQVKAAALSPSFTKVVLHTIKLITLERDRQKMLIPAAP